MVAGGRGPEGETATVGFEALINRVFEDAQAVLDGLEALKGAAAAHAFAVGQYGQGGGRKSIAGDEHWCQILPSRDEGVAPSAAGVGSGEDEEAPARPVRAQRQPEQHHLALPNFEIPGMMKRGGDRIRHSMVATISHRGKNFPRLRRALSTVSAGSEDGAGATDTKSEDTDKDNEAEEMEESPSWSYAREQAASVYAAEGSSLQLDSRWRDLFITNDLGDESDMLDGLRPRGALLAKRESTIRGALGRVRQSSWGDLAGMVVRTRVFSPNHPLRLLWDVFGMWLVLYDLLTVPMYVGWDVMTLTDDPSAEQAVMLMSAVFWCFDVFFNFNTGFVRQEGTMEESRIAIANSYLRSWLPFDLFLVSLDLARYILPTAATLRTIRALRAVRILRCIRILKKSSLGEFAEELLTSMGVQWLLLVASIFKTLFCIFLASHVCSCIWYAIGKHARREGLPCWLDQMEAQGGDIDNIFFQYIRAMYWVLGNLTACQVDNNLAAVNQDERLFTLGMIILSVLVMATAISNMTNLSVELSKINDGAVSTRRQLQRYLTAAQMPRDLATRVVRFALYSHRRQASLFLDPDVASLLSERLRSEISRIQRSRYLLAHPLFKLIEEAHSEVFSQVCDAVKARVYADSDIVFTAGTLATNFYMTHDGTFKLITAERYVVDAGAPTTQLFHEPAWFAEICLFSKWVHRSTLSAVTFGDAFTLAQQDLMDCVKVSPSCVNCSYRYAEEFVDLLWDGPARQDIMRFSAHDVIPVNLATKAAEQVRANRNTLKDLMSLRSPSVDGQTLESVLAMVHSKEMDPDRVIELLPEAFSELREEEGVYARLNQMDERGRVLSAMSNAIWLLQDRYDLFVDCQHPGGRMSREGWQEWQKFVEWAGLSPEMFHGMLVFLAIRGLGKVSTFSKLLPRNKNSPEDVVRYLIDTMPQLTPSAVPLAPKIKRMIHHTLKTLSKFNFAQLLQGENTPFHINKLRESVEKGGQDILKFYCFSLVSVMCGLGGLQESRKGSSFMTERNSSHALMVIRALRQVAELNPVSVYWGYITARGEQLGLPTDGQEQLVVARLACLCRANAAESNALVAAWQRLPRADRMSLARHFLANGIDEPAFAFTFLPQYFANAKGNKVVGIDRAFKVFIDLLDALREEDYAAQTDSQIVVVDIKDLAVFTKDVSSPRVFLATVTQSTLVAYGGEVHVLISTKHKQRSKQTSWGDDPDMVLAAAVRKIQRQVNGIEATAEEILTTSHAPPGGEWDTTERSL